MVAACIAKYGRVDVLFNNVGMQVVGGPLEVKEEDWDRLMTVNVKSMYLACRAVIPHMLKQGGGSIINLGSPTGMTGCAPNLTAYSTSKAGIYGLTRAMAGAYARDGIRVNILIPGTMDTPMNAPLLDDKVIREQYREAVPMGRLGRPCDIEGIAVFLASEDSSYCTGGLYTCDGGLTAV